MIPSGRPQLLTARGVLPRAGRFDERSFQPARVLRDAGVLVSGGRVVELVVGAAAIRRLATARSARVRDLGDVCLVPGLVNAHAHLELTGMEGALPGDAGFGAWVGGLLRNKAARGVEGLAMDARVGLERALQSGTTTLGDIASTPACATALARIGRGARPRVRLFREVLDAWDPARTLGALVILRRPLRESTRLFEGYSPHAPYTVSLELLLGVARLARRRPRPVSLHWSETQAEVDWMRAGTGELAAVLGASPLRSGLDLLEAAGLFGSHTSLVHGNLPAARDPARIAAAGASIVHCPGTHAFFSRGEFPLGAYERAGVNLALGTDSLASNDTLDLRVEAVRFLEREPGLAPGRILHMLTEGGARALGLEADVGRLEPGCFADALVLEGLGSAFPATADDVAVALLRSGPPGAAGDSAPLYVLLGGHPRTYRQAHFRPTR